MDGSLFCYVDLNSTLIKSCLLAILLNVKPMINFYFSTLKARQNMGGEGFTIFNRSHVDSLALGIIKAKTKNLKYIIQQYQAWLAS